MEEGSWSSKYYKFPAPWKRSETMSEANLNTISEANLNTIKGANLKTQTWVVDLVVVSATPRDYSKGANLKTQT